jgi:hypothetical protein
MRKKLIKLLVLCSLSAIIVSSIATSEVVADSSAQFVFQTMSHGIGGS